VELYTSTDNTAKPVNVDLVKWLNNGNKTGSRETETGSNVSDKVNIISNFSTHCIFSISSNKRECLVLPTSCCIFFEYVE